MIRSVRLEIGWGERFCDGFALVARELGGLLGLRELVLVFVGGEEGEGRQRERSALGMVDANGGIGRQRGSTEGVSKRGNVRSLG